MPGNATTYIAVPENEWNELKQRLSEILEKVSAGLSTSKTPHSIQANYITALEFMTAVKIKRTKFDLLVRMSKSKY